MCLGAQQWAPPPHTPPQTGTKAEAAICKERNPDSKKRTGQRSTWEFCPGLPKAKRTREMSWETPCPTQAEDSQAASACKAKHMLQSSRPGTQGRRQERGVRVPHFPRPWHRTQHTRDSPLSFPAHSTPETVPKVSRIQHTRDSPQAFPHRLGLAPAPLQQEGTWFSLAGAGREWVEFPWGRQY